MSETSVAVRRQAHARPRAGIGAQVGRTLWGLFFIGGATFNAIFTLSQPEIYRAFAQLSFFGWYRDALLSIALPNATVITSVVILLELSAGLVILFRGMAVRVGLMATAVWVVFLWPAMGWYTAWCPLLIVIPLLLLRFDYERDVVSAAVGAIRR